MTQAEAKRQACAMCVAELEHAKHYGPESFDGCETEEDEERIAKALDELHEEMLRRSLGQRRAEHGDTKHPPDPATQ